MVVRTGKKATKYSSSKATADTPKVKAEAKEEEPQEEEESEEEEEESDEESSESEEDEFSKKRKGTKGGKENKKSNAPSPASHAPNTNRGGNNNNNRNMAFDKGTYIFRLSDLELDPVKDCIWRIDNHQLLQRYNPEKPDEKDIGRPRKYKRTQNYTGWMCQEGWDYIKLEVTGMYRNQGKEEEVTVRYPKPDQIEDHREIQRRKKAEQSSNDN